MADFVRACPGLEGFAHVAMGAAFETRGDRDANLDQLPRFGIERTGCSDGVAQFVVCLSDVRVGLYEIGEALRQTAHLYFNYTEVCASRQYF